MKLYHIFSGSKAAIYVGDEINPQSIYEAAAAWLPIFVSGNVRMAGNILNQTRWIKVGPCASSPSRAYAQGALLPAVQVTQWFHKGPAAELAEDFHQDFFDFLDMAQEDWQWLIMKWNQENAMVLPCAPLRCSASLLAVIPTLGRAGGDSLPRNVPEDVPLQE